MLILRLTLAVVAFVGSWQLLLAAQATRAELRLTKNEVIITGSRTLNVKRHERFDLKCLVQNAPDFASIEWHLPASSQRLVVLDDSDSVARVTIDRAELTDLGNYTCRVVDEYFNVLAEKWFVIKTELVQPFFHPPNRTDSVVQGETFTKTCIAFGAEDRAEWIAIDGQSITMLHNTRVQQVAHNQALLTITDAQKVNEGNYHCVSRRGTRVSRHSQFRLVVEQPPALFRSGLLDGYMAQEPAADGSSVFLEPAENSYSVEIGAMQTIPCSVDEADMVTWTLPPRTDRSNVYVNFVSATSAELVIRKMVPAAAGTYTCVRSLAGQTDTNPVRVDLDTSSVQRPTLAIAVAGQDDDSATEVSLESGSRLELTCSVTNGNALKPAPVTPLLWFKDNALLRVDGVSMENPAGSVTFSADEVYRGRDDGVYSCRMYTTAQDFVEKRVTVAVTFTNTFTVPEIGVDDSSITFSISTSPAVPVLNQRWFLTCVATQRDGSAVRIAWLESIGPGAKLLKHNDSTARIDRFALSDVKPYRCAAVRDITERSSPAIRAVRAYYPQFQTRSPISVSPSVIVTYDGASANATCSSEQSAGASCVPDWVPPSGGTSFPDFVRVQVGQATRKQISFSSLQSPPSRVQYFSCYCRGVDQSANLIIVADSLARQAPAIAYPPRDGSTRYVVSGQSVSLFCAANGIPSPTVTWTVPNTVPRGIPVIAQGNPAALTIRNFLDSYSGAFTCTATGADAGQSDSTVVTVQTSELPPVISFSVSPLQVPINGNGQVTCLATGVPRPTSVSWRPNPTANVRFSSVKNINDTTVAITLTVSNAQRGDMQLYTCSAANKVGTAESSVRVDVDSQCGQNDFECKVDGSCIPARLACDGRIDCSDGADERGCAPSQLCTLSQTRCASGECIPRYWVCDGDADCVDRSDETDCPRATSNCVRLQGCDATCLTRGQLCDATTNCYGNQIDEIWCKTVNITYSPTGVTVLPGGSTATFVCNATGFAPPLIIWRRNGAALPSSLRATESIDYVIGNQFTSYSVGTLTITNAQMSDSGQYSCQAINSKTVAVSNTFSLMVQECTDVCQAPMYNVLAGSTAECRECFCSNVSNVCTSSSYRLRTYDIRGRQSLVTSRPVSKLNEFKIDMGSGRQVPAFLLSRTSTAAVSNLDVTFGDVNGTSWYNFTLPEDTSVTAGHFLYFYIPASSLGLTSDSTLLYGSTITYEMYVSTPSSVSNIVVPFRTGQSEYRLCDTDGQTGDFRYLYSKDTLVRGSRSALRPTPVDVGEMYHYADMVVKFDANTLPNEYYVNKTVRSNSWNRMSFQLTESDAMQTLASEFQLMEESDVAILWLEQNTANRASFMTKLPTLDGVLLRAVYSNKQEAIGIRNLRITRVNDDLERGSASSCATDNLASLVENCTCPVGYVGAYCQQCAPGFDRIWNPKNSTWVCTNCSCNKHAFDCTGSCCTNCQHGTTGPSCSECAPGYYRTEEPIDSQGACRRCDCGTLAYGHSYASTCSSANDCDRCPEYNTGTTCDSCVDGYRNDGDKTCYRTSAQCPPEASYATVQGDTCNCTKGTVGDRCDYCRSGYFGRALLTQPALYPTCMKCYCFNQTDLCAENKDILYWRKFVWSASEVSTGSAHYKHWKIILLPSTQRPDDLIDRRLVPKNWVISGLQLGKSEITMHQTNEDANGGYILTFDSNSDWSLRARPTNKQYIPMYCMVPRCWLGDLVTSYGGFIGAKVFFDATKPVRPFDKLPVFAIQGDNEMQLVHFTNDLIRKNDLYQVRLHEDFWRVAGSQRKPTRIEFLNVLARTRDIYVKCAYEVSSENGLVKQTGLKTFQLDIASQNVTDTSVRAHSVEQCLCPSGYEGTSCERCAEGYYRDGATGQCKCCDCNGRSEKCYETDGFCIACRDNTGGARCERCADGFYGDPSSPEGCRRCDCWGGVTSCRTTQNGNNYTCNCPPTATGARCEICVNPNRRPQNAKNAPCKAPNSPDCGCNADGTVPDKLWKCADGTSSVAQCDCKPLAIGIKCDRCYNESYFNLNANNPLGCDRCFCSGRSNRCTSGGSTSTGRYRQVEIEPTYMTIADSCNDNATSAAEIPEAEEEEFEFRAADAPQRNRLKIRRQMEACTNDYSFTVVSQPGMSEQVVGGVSRTGETEMTATVAAGADAAAYWKLPTYLTRDGVGLYASAIGYQIRLPSVPASAEHDAYPDVIIASFNRFLIANYSRLPAKRDSFAEYSMLVDQSLFRTYDVENDWNTQAPLTVSNYAATRPVTREEMLSALSYITGIYIRATYQTGAGESSLRDLRVQAVRLSNDKRFSVAPKAVEMCISCPAGYGGFSCELCTAGYKIDTSNPAFPRTCVPCSCNGQSQTCNMETGKCTDCQGNTEGDSCQRCKKGFMRTSSDLSQPCVPCECPFSSRAGYFAVGCETDESNPSQYTCQCQDGHTGAKCDSCLDSHFGNPLAYRRCEPIGITINYKLAYAPVDGSTSLECNVQPVDPSLDTDTYWMTAAGNVIESGVGDFDKVTITKNQSWTRITFGHATPLIENTYKCCVKRGSWQSCDSGEVKVTEPPAFVPTLTTNLSRCAVAQESVAFECAVSSDVDYLHYEFRSLNYSLPAVGNFSQLQVNGPSAVLRDASRSHNGTFTCSVHPQWKSENAADAAVSNPVKFCVVDPYVRLTVSPTENPDEEMNVTLECRLEPFGVAVAQRDLEIRNFHTGDLPDQIVVVAKNSSYIRVDFLDVTMAVHEGTYECRALYGQFRPYYLKHQGKVEIKQNVPTVKLNVSRPWYLENDTITMQCLFSGSGIDHFGISIVKKTGETTERVVSTSASYTVPKAQMSDAGNYFCRALRPSDSPEDGVLSPTVNVIVYNVHLNAAPLNRRVQIGRTGVFECQIKPEGLVEADAPLVWRRLDGALLRAGSTVNTSTNYAMLQINDVKSRDAVAYQCTAMFRRNRLPPQQVLLVIDVPKDLRVSLVFNQAAYEQGQAVEMKCVTSSQLDEDDVEYSFSFGDNQPLPTGARKNNDVVTIPSADASVHAGYYTCSAIIEGFRPTVSVPTLLNISAEVASVAVSPAVTLRALNTSATFSCVVKGIPKPVAQWTARRIDPRNPAYNPDTMQVTIGAASPDNVGEYICGARNDMGSAQASGLLYAYDVNKAQSFFKRNIEIAPGANRQRVTLNCYAPAGSTIFWQRSQGSLPLPDTAEQTADGKLIITVGSGSVGEYNCIAMAPNSYVNVANGSSYLVADIANRTKFINTTAGAVPGVGLNVTCPLSADMRGKQPIVIKWYRRDRKNNMTPVQVDESVKIIDNVIVIDELKSQLIGVYTCVATSSNQQETINVALVATNLVPLFKTESRMQFPSVTRFNVFDSSRIELVFKPNKAGLVFYNGNENNDPSDFIALGVKDNTVQFSYDLGSGQPVTLTSGRVTLNSWINATIVRVGRNVSLYVDDILQQNQLTPGDKTALDLGGSLYFGAQEEALQATGYSDAFEGVVSHFSVNGASLRFGQEYIDLANIEQYDTCTVERVSCSSGRGQCLADNTNNGYRCVCYAGYGGADCSHTGEKCSPYVCGMFGQCTSKGRTSGSTASDSSLCACPVGVNGRRCEIGVPISTPAFGGGVSYATYPEMAVTYPMEFDLVLAPLERDDSATVFVLFNASQRATFLALIISDERFEFMAADGSRSAVATGSRMISKKWTRITARVTAAELSLTVDGTTTTAPNTLSTVKFGGLLHLGFPDRAPTNPLLPQEAFEGVVSSLQVNGVQMGLSYPAVNHRGVIDGSMFDNCQPHMCSNHGVCMPNMQSEPATCDCPNYRGDTCALLKDVCSSREAVCQNDGVCRPNADWYTCQCPAEFSGDKCEIRDVSYSATFKQAYLQLPSFATENKDRETIEFTFKSNSQFKGSTFLMSYGTFPNPRMYVGVTVVKGKVQMHVGYQIGAAKFEWTSKKKQTHVKGQAYAVKIERVSNTITITEDGEVLADQLSMEFDQPIDNYDMTVTDGLFVGGTPDLATNQEIGFGEYPDACISNFAIDGKKFDFKKVQTSVTTLPGGAFTLDC